MNPEVERQFFAGKSGVEALVSVMASLRDPQSGCPWDLVQDFSTIAPYTVEEAYEVLDAIERGTPEQLKDELGDLLLQTVYHARIGEELGLFDLDAIATGAARKMISRHPHVFGPESREKSPETQTIDWENIKETERQKAGNASVLSGVAKALPALTRALNLQKRAARVGFDWPNASGVVAKLDEEARELICATSAGDKEAADEEFGDLLFTLVNLGRHLSLDPEAALRRANDKFEERFRHMERLLSENGHKLDELQLAELEEAWQEAKADCKV